MDATLFQWVAGLTFTVLTAMFGAILKRIYQLIDKLENDKADRSEVQAMLRRIDEHIQEDRDQHRENRQTAKEITAKLDDTNRHLSMTNTTLAALAAKFEVQSNHRPRS